ncbi:MAG: multiheme c-type cytochrome [Bacteroidetes bacterium]|nr:multiheme c-type cytochrome [Bacteroidota bacterium]
MPQQVKRLLIAFVIFVALFLGVRHFLVPKTFGKYGHYDAKALEANAAHDVKYIDAQDCSNCHTDIDSLKMAGKHAKINCQTCHGPGYKHLEDPSANPLIKPTERAFCGKCHEKNAARPTNIIKQQDLSKHNPDSKCVECHNPHQP